MIIITHSWVPDSEYSGKNTDSPAARELTFLGGLWAPADTHMPPVAVHEGTGVSWHTVGPVACWRTPKLFFSLISNAHRETEAHRRPFAPNHTIILQLRKISSFSFPKTGKIIL